MSRPGATIYEYACEERNYAMADMLAGARAEERRAAGQRRNRLRPIVPKCAKVNG